MGEKSPSIEMKTQKQEQLERRFNQIPDGIDYMITVAQYNESMSQAKTQQQRDAIVKRFNKQLTKQGVAQ